VGSRGAGADRAAPGSQGKPRVITIDEDSALVQNTIQQERGSNLDPIEMRNVDTATCNLSKAPCQVDSRVRSRGCE
jgi:hypothetical protein